MRDKQKNTLTSTIKESLTVQNTDSVIQTPDKTHLSPRFMEAMKDFTCAITQFRVKNNMINNTPESIKNDLIEGLLQNAGMVSRCIKNVAPVVMSIEEDVKKITPINSHKDS